MSAQPLNQAQSKPAEYAARLSGVKFGWAGKETILDIPSFAIKRGERVFVSGPSGCGKSTLLSLIAGILTPNEGAIEIIGLRIDKLSGARRDCVRGDLIGYIFQRFNLISYLSIIENTLIPCRLSRFRRDRARDQAQDEVEAAKALLTRLDLAPSLWGEPVSRLSVGQQQRVAAARALIGAPPLLIADEPTSSLDENRRGYFLRLLSQACKETGSSLLFVSHDRTLEGEFDRAIAFESLNRATAPKEL
ncbi:MAG: ATP-binding cassette domain-containing protein [Helicobacteraceae bacterium]|jgi:putative ABC transport system ATP-binding protein|nr:ATP-binding cassette domain-containing protein [Helicobacteraceae bacterium]